MQGVIDADFGSTFQTWMCLWITWVFFFVKKCRYWLIGSRTGPGTLHFQQAPRWWRCCLMPRTPAWIARDDRVGSRYTVSIPWCCIFASFPLSIALWGDEAKLHHFGWDHKQSLLCDGELLLPLLLSSSSPSWPWAVSVVLSQRGRKGPPPRMTSMLPILCKPELVYSFDLHIFPRCLPRPWHCETSEGQPGKLPSWSDGVVLFVEGKGAELLRNLEKIEMFVTFGEKGWPLCIWAGWGDRSSEPKFSELQEGYLKCVCRKTLGFIIY